MPRRFRATRHALAAVLACAPAAAQQPAQPPARDLHADLGAGSEAEAYLRTLQLVGIVPLHPVSVRAFSPREARMLAPDGAHPWDRFYRATERTRRVAAVPATVSATYNSAFPYGMNDGPVWAGRGLTVSALAGVALRAGPLSVQLAPTAFHAQNRAFVLAPTGEEGRLAYGDPLTPERIDLPQRFGDGAYARVDPGESFVRLDVGRLAVGISTAAQQWGPAVHQPIILGPNAGGFPHVFLGTSAPANVYLGRLQARVLWGDLSQSDWSPVDAGPGSRRFFSGVVASFTPRGIPGLEIGGVRVFQVAWPDGGVGPRDLVKLFDPFAKGSLPDLDSTGSRASPDNQLASAFVRWVLPSAGLEVYAEYGREDHNWDLLDFYLQPDHQSAYSLGFRKAWRRGPGVLWVARGELMNSQASHLLEARKQPAWYQHGGTPQGHTQRGQLLGAPFGHGGGGSVVGVDRYGPGGRASLGWIRGRMGQDWSFDADGTVRPGTTDVLHALQADGVVMRRRADLTWGVAAVFNLNRHFGDDAFNLNGRLGMRVPF